MSFNFFEIFGLIIGLVYLYYEYHADPKVWIASFLMPANSMIVYFRKGLYADFGMNIYYLLMAVYGYLAWTGRIKSRRKHSGAQLPITHMPLKALVPVVPVTGVLWIAIALFLNGATNSTVPWADAFTTALSITATWMLARKYIEQWWAWILVDIVCVGLYIYKEIYPYALLYSIYVVIAAFGYRKWRRDMQTQA